MPNSSLRPVCIRLTRQPSLRLLLSALGVALIALVSVSSAAAANHYVDPGGTCGGNVPCYTTIQAAVNGAAPTDTIFVGPGTYPELVTVNKQLTLRGAQAGIAATSCRTGLAATESVVTGNAGTTAFYVTANDVTLDGFTVQGQTSSTQFGAGIVLGAGINGSDVLNNIVRNNVIGLMLANNSATNQAVIRGNLFLTNNTPGSGSGHGIYTDQFLTGGNLTNVLIDSNTFRGNSSGGIGFSSTTAASQSEITVSNNEFDANSRAMYMFNLSFSEISGNNIHNSTDGATADIRIFEGTNNVTISCNTIINGAGRGIRVNNIGTGSPNSSSLTANFNNISGNTVAGLVVDAGGYSGVFNAESNWWGSATGPTIASNPGGTGDVIVDPGAVVDYRPFLTTAATCSTLQTSPGNQQGWTAAGAAAGGVVQFVNGPPVPPLGDGSLRIFTGTQGDQSREFRNANYNGTSLSTLTGLGYCTRVTSWNGGQAPYLILRVDRDNDGDIDDLLFFEPLYSNGSFNPAIPAQPNPVLNTWQCWNALKGGWYGLDATTFTGNFGGPGAGVLPFTDYTTAFPSAVLRNAPAGVTGAIRLLSGFASPADVFDSNSDAFQVGVGSNLITFDFEPSQPTTMAKTAGDNQGTLVNTPFPINLQVTVLDEAAAGVPGAAVTFTAPSSGASGTFAGGCLTVTVFTDVNGVATAPQFTANGQAGNYIVPATSPGLPTANFALRNMISPTAADARISGRVVRTDGSPIAGTVIELSGSQTRKTITDSLGSYRFEDVETGGFYTVTPSLANYSFGPEKLSFSQIGNTTEALFTGTPNAVMLGNAIDWPEYFVRQHYLDFLGREPDEAGFNFWSDQILSCGSDAGCVERRTINVSAAYFLSIEFQRTGGLVDGLYRATFDRQPRYAEFMPDTRALSRDVVVGRTGWEQQLRDNKGSFANAFVERAEFRAAFDGLSNQEYVDRLIGHTGVAFSSDERNALVADLGANRLTRAGVLLRIAEDERFVSARRNEAFVMMQYFGYLRRDPDRSGYEFWLKKLNDFGGNFEQAEMVKAFISSTEYRSRFKP